MGTFLLTYDLSVRLTDGLPETTGRPAQGPVRGSAMMMSRFAVRRSSKTMDVTRRRRAARILKRQPYAARKGAARCRSQPLFVRARVPPRPTSWPPRWNTAAGHGGELPHEGAHGPKRLPGSRFLGADPGRVDHPDEVRHLKTLHSVSGTTAPPITALAAAGRSPHGAADRGGRHCKKYWYKRPCNGLRTHGRGRARRALHRQFPHRKPRIPVERLPLAINTHTRPEDIVVRDTLEVADVIFQRDPLVSKKGNTPTVFIIPASKTRSGVNRAYFTPSTSTKR